MAPISFILAIGLAASVLAHPGESHSQEAAERAAFVKRSPNSVRSCSNNLQRRGLIDTAAQRRQHWARSLRRDTSSLSTSHASSLDVSLGSSELDLFSDNSSCILQPEVTQGPYYINGELVRHDVRETQEGIPLYLDIQLIDTSDCSPVPAVFMEIWHCNATGVYSGVVASGNGNSADSSNLDNTFLRGIQSTDVNGVAQFVTIVPGHYTGRATHIHVMSYNSDDTTIRLNGTLLGSNFTAHASHVGQIFFDQDLLSQVATVSPYSSNTQTVTENSSDSILAEEAADMDPFVEYVLLGDDISDGILAWISIGIDPTADNSITSAGTHYASGGVANSNSNMGGGGGGAPGNGTGPGGSFPSGGMPSGMRSGQASGVASATVGNKVNTASATAKVSTASVSKAAVASSACEVKTVTVTQTM